MLKLLLIIPILQIVCTSAQESPIQSATQTESPWMVYFEVKGHRCGGAMIDDYHVLTAAHCFDRIKYSEFKNTRKLREALKIRIGEWKTESDPDCGEDVSDEVCDTTADILPKEVILHEKYNKRDQDKRFQYDIAIIKLGWPPRRSEVINVLRLTNPERCEEATSGEFWKTTGFGGDSKVKKRMEMVLLSHEECVKSIDESHLRKLNEDVHVCGRGLNGEKTCKGDAGSPVTNLVEGIPYLQGIVTFTDEEECIETETNTASVFLRVPCFYEWIHSKVPNISHAFIEKPKPPPTSGENEDTGSIEVFVAGESTTARPLGTTHGKIPPPTTTTTARSRITPSTSTRSTTKFTTSTRRVVTSRSTTTEAIKVTNEPDDYHDDKEPEADSTTRATTQAWRRKTTPKPISTTKPVETTTEDESIHFNVNDPKNPNYSFSSASASSASSSANNDKGHLYDIRIDTGDDKVEETSTTESSNRFKKFTKSTRATTPSDY
ncbi:hypothetical protein ACKWTF_014146 [Chironomus riparius]